MKLCECGCGAPAPISKMTYTKEGRVAGQPCRFLPGHNNRNTTPTLPRAYKQRYVPKRLSPTGRPDIKLEHVLIAETVLGRPLPSGAQVHHFDGNRLNNAHTNLVICQSAAYHKLLHVRARVLKAGGDPNTQHVCSLCKVVKDKAEFARATQRTVGLQNACKACMRLRDKGRWRRGKKSEREDWRDGRKGRAA